MSLDRTEADRIRFASIAAGNFPEVMELEEAALFLRVSVSWLQKDTTVPRTYPTGRSSTGRGHRILFLKSQLMAHLENRLSHRADVNPEPKRRKAS